MQNHFSLAIHGGAGTILKSKMTPEKEARYLAVLEQSLLSGNQILKNGGSSLDAVEAAVVVMEDSDLFNAGKGSVFTSDGAHEMEASIMCGRTLQAGAAAGVRCLKNPVSLTRKILDDEDLIYLFGSGAEDYARLHDLEMAEPSYFYSEERFRQWQSIKNTGQTALDHSDDRKFGTVGAVASDMHGNIAAATSTGGLTNKRFGRVGDSSVIGAGVYANNRTCGISCTGYGEFFLRGVVAYDISCLMEYRGLSLEDAAQVVINQKQAEMGGEGGIIGVDHQGKVSMVFNSEGMYRGKVENGEVETAIYR